MKRKRIPRTSKAKLEFARQLRYNPTAAESILWAQLRNRQIKNNICIRQKVLYGYIVDFYFPSSLVAIEVDGSIHSTIEQQKIDALKDKVLRRNGIIVYRVSNEEVFSHIESVLNKITELCILIPEKDRGLT